MIKTLRSVLSRPWAYESFSRLLGGSARNRTLVRDYIRPRPGDRVLDIGCGPGTMAACLPDSEYLGFDASPEYIDSAKRRFPGMRFVCQRVSRYNLVERDYFDIVLAIGVLHHLDDAEAVTLFELARDAMKPGGRLITVDGVWTDDQSRAVKYLLSRDRGRFVRTQAAYRELASGVFSKVEASVRHDLLRIPYTMIILQCVR